MPKLSTFTMNLLSPPSVVKGITELKKDLFSKNVSVPCLTVDTRCISELSKIVKKYFLKLENFKCIKNIDSAKNIIYMNPNIINDITSFSTEEQDILKKFNIENVQYHNLTLTYENFSHESIFKAILPEEKEGMASFTKVGHIVHVNLREHLLPYKFIIGNVLLDKIKGCDSVVNKVNMIDNTYRNFSMEVLAGNNNMKTQVKENGCLFDFDFSNVYWNSRLCTEHERIIKKLNISDILFDVFAGVGPFAIPAAKKGCQVYANDLNPEAFKWLNHNIKLNNINSNKIETHQKDGKDFIKNVIKTLLKLYYTQHRIHIVMNLPALAADFLKEFINLYELNEIEGTLTNVNLYVYCFVKGDDYTSLAKSLILDKIGFDISSKITEIFKVRTVSSMKEMVRVTISLDEDILCNSFNVLKRKFASEELQENKKKCEYGEKKDIKCI